MANTSNSVYDIIKEEESNALQDIEDQYGGMIEGVEQNTTASLENIKNWENTQTELQNQQTQHTINQIEQQKEQAEKDYTKEQSAAYVDWQKQSNPYGANAEQMASAGLTNTGYSESSQVSMYNTYQNRVATARESYNQAVLNYNNAMETARLQNSAALAEIAFSAFEKQLTISLQGFQYKNQLILDMSNKKTQTKQYYADLWQNVLGQINDEEKTGGLIVENTEPITDPIDPSGTTRHFVAGFNVAMTPKATIDSILALGYGSDITLEELYELVKNGSVEEYTVNGVKLFRRTNTSSTKKQNAERKEYLEQKKRK